MAAVTAAVAVSAAGTAYAANRQSRAAREASNAQERQGNRAIESNEQALDTARSDLSPFRQVGASALNPLFDSAIDGSNIYNASIQEQQGRGLLSGSVGGLRQNLVNANDPSFTQENVTGNPLFQNLLGQATDRITGNNAARGKLGSGDTLSDLTNSSLAIGTDLYSRELAQQNTNTSNLMAAAGLGSGLVGAGSNLRNTRNNQLFNIASLGSNAAAGQATATQNTASNNSSLLTQIGNAQAAGHVGRANAATNGVNNLVGIAGLAAGRAR